jgi:hypothetical protein
MHTPRFEGSPTRIDKFGGKVRRIAVEGMLAAASSEMAKRIGARVDVSWDYDAWGNVDQRTVGACLWRESRRGAF